MYSSGFVCAWFYLCNIACYYWWPKCCLQACSRDHRRALLHAWYTWICFVPLLANYCTNIAQPAPLHVSWSGNSNLMWPLWFPLACCSTCSASSKYTDAWRGIVHIAKGKGLMRHVLRTALLIRSWLQSGLAHYGKNGSIVGNEETQNWMKSKMPMGPSSKRHGQKHSLLKSYERDLCTDVSICLFSALISLSI